MWHIRLENGEEMAAYPEEICQYERDRECVWGLEARSRSEDEASL